jgi:exonuclease SbcD
MRLSRANIPTLLLVGNHDLSPAAGRAHALDPFSTLEVPNVHVLDKPCFLGPEDLHGLELQVIALPWISRSGMMAQLDIRASDPAEVYDLLEQKISQLIDIWLEKANPYLPTILTAHASVQGASFGGERTVLLGSDLVLPGSLVKDPRFDYVALGHIHKPQDLNKDNHPPVIYPGSIERVNFGEAKEDKFYIVAQVESGKTDVDWRKLEHIRPFIDRYVKIEDPEHINEKIRSALPRQERLTDAIVRLTIEYHRDWEASIDEAALREHASTAFEFHLVKRPQTEARLRLPENQALSGMAPADLVDLYWKASHTPEDERESLQEIAKTVIEQVARGE